VTKTPEPSRLSAMTATRFDGSDDRYNCATSLTSTVVGETNAPHTVFMLVRITALPGAMVTVPKVMMTKEAVRKLFDEYVQRSSIVLRSCWNRNPSHEHLKTGKFAMLCFACGRHFFQGVDVTPDGAKPKSLL